MCADPRVALLVIDPDDSSRWIEVRGRAVEITPQAQKPMPTGSPGATQANSISMAMFIRPDKSTRKPASSSESNR